jgi:hypothetical protein
MYIYIYTHTHMHTALQALVIMPQYSYKTARVLAIAQALH